MTTWITVEKAASLLNVPTVYVYGLINQGEFNSVRGCLLSSEVMGYDLDQGNRVIECVALLGDEG